MKNTLILSLLLLAAASALRAQAGADGMAFLKLGVGARSLGMGEAAVAAASDPTAAYYNPAALALSNRTQILLMHKSWIQDTKTEYIAAQTMLGSLRFGLAINATSVDNIELRSVPGPPEGTFSARNSAIGFSLAYDFDHSFAVGATVNYLYEKIFIDEATGLGLNFGALYFGPSDIRFAASVNNLGSMQALDLVATKLPTSVRFGAARTSPLESIQSSFTLAADIVSYTNESKTHLHAGAEVNYHDTFAMRLGYLTGYDARSVTAGIGIHYGLLNFDYAYAPFRYDFGTTHTLSLGFLL
jgi:hypothetical protein